MLGTTGRSMLPHFRDRGSCRDRRFPVSALVDAVHGKSHLEKVLCRERLVPKPQFHATVGGAAAHSSTVARRTESDARTARLCARETAVRRLLLECNTQCHQDNGSPSVSANVGRAFSSDKRNLSMRFLMRYGLVIPGATMSCPQSQISDDRQKGLSKQLKPSLWLRQGLWRLLNLTCEREEERSRQKMARLVGCLIRTVVVPSSPVQSLDASVWCAAQLNRLTRVSSLSTSRRPWLTMAFTPVREGQEGNASSSLGVSSWAQHMCSSDLELFPPARKRVSISNQNIALSHSAALDSGSPQCHSSSQPLAGSAVQCT